MTSVEQHQLTVAALLNVQKVFFVKQAHITDPCKLVLVVHFVNGPLGCQHFVQQGATPQHWETLDCLIVRSVQKAEHALRRGLSPPYAACPDSSVPAAQLVRLDTLAHPAHINPLLSKTLWLPALPAPQGHFAQLAQVPQFCAQLERFLIDQI